MINSDMKPKLDKDIFAIKIDAVFATVSLDGILNIVPIHSKHLISRNKVLISDQFMNKTKNNIMENPHGTLCIIHNEKMYTIMGKCAYRNSGFMYRMAVRGAKKYAEKHAKNKNIMIKCKGIILMNVYKVKVEEM